MNYTMYPAESGQYIVLEIKGEINTHKAMQQNKEAHALGRKLGIHRFLVDARQARNTDSVFQQYEFAYDQMPRAEGIDRRAVVALVVAEDDHSHDFIETVSRNAGFNVSLFRNIDEAIDFIKGAGT